MVANKRPAEVVIGEDLDTYGQVAYDRIVRAREVRKVLDSETEKLVAQARVEGFSWEAIATALGTSKQAAHEKYGSPSDPRTLTDLINGKPLRVQKPKKAQPLTRYLVALTDAQRGALRSLASVTVDSDEGGTALTTGHSTRSTERRPQEPTVRELNCS